MRLLRITILAVSLLSLFAQGIRAQEPGVLIPLSVSTDFRYTVHQYHRNNGLSGNNTLDIIHESDGHVLFTMEDGIYIFDGYLFRKVINELNNPVARLFHSGLMNISYGITASKDLYEISSENRYLGSANALDVSDNRLYSVSQGGEISIFGIPRFTPIGSIPTGIESCTNLCHSGSTILLTDQEHVYVISEDKKTISGIFSVPSVFKIVEDTLDGSFILICSSDLYRLKNNKISRIFHSDTYVGFTDCAITGRDSFFLTSYRGLYEILGNKIAVYDEKDGLPSHSLNGLAYESGSGRLWIATGNKGVLRLEPKFAKTYYRTGEIGDYSLGSVLGYSGNRIIAVENNRILLLDPKTDSIRNIFNHARPQGVFLSLSVWGDTLAIGTWGSGILLVRNGKLIGKIYSSLTPSTIVTGCFIDRRGAYWIATEYGIMYGETLERFRPLGDRNIRNFTISFCQLRNGDICAGSASGLTIYSENLQLKAQIGAAEGLACREVRSFYEDAEGLLWIGTSAGGLYCYENGKVTSINQMQGCALPKDIFTFAKTPAGSIYFSTNNGLWAVQEDKLRNFYRGKLSQLIPFHYDESHGILNTEFNGGFQNNYFADSDGTLYFPTVQGLVAFRPPKFEGKPLGGHIDHVVINGIRSDSLPSVLERDTRTIEIVTGSVNLERSRNAYLQYKLERNGISSIWSAIRKENRFSFLVQEAGEYTLYLRVVDALFPENNIVTAYKFSIKPYFYETILFQVLTIVFLLIISVVVIRLIVLRRESVRETAFQINNTILMLEMQALQARMNPHFVFNILNNLKSLVSIGNTEKAESMISNFSVLLRKSFEKSNETILSLGDEIDIVALYLKLQAQRMNNEFTFSVICPEALRNIKIPSFIIQPLVENAIVHGIAHSENHCHLEIECSGNDNTLVVAVRDNGIGRVKSGKINSRKSQHQSKGLELVSKKLQIARDIYGMEGTLSFEDADAESGEGTIATVKINYHA